MVFIQCLFRYETFPLPSLALLRENSIAKTAEKYTQRAQGNTTFKPLTIFAFSCGSA